MQIPRVSGVSAVVHRPSPQYILESQKRQIRGADNKRRTNSPGISLYDPPGDGPRALEGAD